MYIVHRKYNDKKSDVSADLSKAAKSQPVNNSFSSEVSI